MVLFSQRPNLPEITVRKFLVRITLRSRRPFTRVLFGESPKMLQRVLSECFLGFPKKCPGECPENWECPRECSRECLSSFFLKEKHSREHSLGHSQFSGHSRGHSPGHFLGNPRKHSESTCRSTFGDSPKSTPVNGRRDRKNNGDQIYFQDDFCDVIFKLRRPKPNIQN